MTDRYRLRSPVLAQDIGDETVLFDMDREYYYALDATGAFCWRLLSAEGRAGTVQALLAEFEVTEAQAAADLDAFIASLLEHNLVEPDA